MKIQAAKKRMKPKITSFMERRRLVKRLVKRTVSKAALKKRSKAGDHNHEVEQPGDGGLVPASCGFVVDGEFVQLTRGFLVNSGTFSYYLPVVDNHGFLLGQFSKLDDLSIVEDETLLSEASFTFPGVNWAVL